MLMLFCRTLYKGNALSRKPIFTSCLAERDMHSEGSKVLFYVYI